MGVIERYQKAILFEEASRVGILNSNLSSVPEVYRKLLGVQDFDRKRFGIPLTDLYPAIPGNLISVDRIGLFTKSLYRDHQVLDLALSDVENTLAFMGLDFWARIQKLKNIATKTAAAAKIEKLRAALGATWSFVDDFTTTDYIDMSNTTAWIDVSEGAAFLPSLGANISVLPSDLTLIGKEDPSNGNSLESSPEMAVDGLPDTNWRALFLHPNTVATATFNLRRQFPLTSISIDPVGFGIQVLLELYDETGTWQQSIKEIIYNKKTFFIEPTLTSSVRITYNPEGSSFPVIAGIRDVILYSNETARTATLKSVLLKPNYPYTEVKIVTDAQLPAGTTITPYFSTDGISWVKTVDGDWFSLGDSTTSTVSLTESDYSSAEAVKGVFKIPIPKQATKLSDGVLEIGGGQMEVSCFRKDWSAFGETNRIPKIEDYAPEFIFKTWTAPGVPVVSILDESSTSMIAQTYGATIYNTPYNVTRGEKIVFSRRTSAYKYTELCFVPFVGSPLNNTMQYNHNYKFSCRVYSPEEVSYDTGRYWFFQGYRTPGAAPYSTTGKSYGAFSMYINNEIVAAERMPATIYSDNTTEPGTDSGKPFLLKLNKGWNTVDILIYVENPYALFSDSLDVGEPYLQLSLTPSVFDPLFQADFGISSLLGSGVKNPTTEFDLIWNLPHSPEFWAWDENRSSILVNQKNTQPIDGYFKGNMPNSVLLYKGTAIGDTPSDLYTRFELERTSTSGLRFGDYKVFVR